MKKLMILVMAVGMMFAVMGANTVMADEGGNSANQYCTSFEDTYPAFFDMFYDSHGDCVSSTRTAPVEICQMLKYYDILEVFGFKNQGQCVSFFRKID